MVFLSFFWISFCRVVRVELYILIDTQKALLGMEYLLHGEEKSESGIGFFDSGTEENSKE